MTSEPSATRKTAKLLGSIAKRRARRARVVRIDRLNRRVLDAPRTMCQACVPERAEVGPSSGGRMTAWAMFVQERLGRIQSPGSPLYWPYVVSAAAIAVLFLKRAAGMTVGDAVRAVASPHVWLTRSTLTDVVMTLAHETLVAVPTLALGACVSNGVLGALGERAAGAIGASGWTAPLVVQSAAVTLAMMLAIDLGTFVAHRLHHAVPFLWEIHAVHHSAEQLTLFTAHRLHPLEALLRA